MSKAIELAENYADAVSTHRLESLYGTSKSYTLEKARERDEAHSALSAELRRLAEVELDREALARHCEKLEADNAALRERLDAIYSTEPVAWLVTGGRMYVDRAYISETAAEGSVTDRKDGSKKHPLIPLPEKP